MAFACLVGYTATVIAYLVFADGPPTPSIADAFGLSLYPFFFTGLLRLPARKRPRDWTLGLDVGIVLLSGALAIWYFALWPVAAGSPDFKTGLFTSAYAIGDMVLLFAVILVTMRTTSAAARRSLRLLLLGTCVYIFSDVVYMWSAVNGALSIAEFTHIGWMVGVSLYILAPLSERDSAVTDEDETTGPSWSISVLPYLATAATIAILVGVNLGHPFFPDLGIALGVAVLGTMVLAREFLAQRALVGAHKELQTAHAELAAIAVTDPLTGLPNHRAMVEAIDAELERSRRYGRPCAVLFIDVDRFKALNDSAGHAVGDLALAGLGQIARESLRVNDIVGRWGGEEFIAVLPEVDREGAFVVAERLRQSIAESDIVPGRDLTVTISVGVAVHPADGHSRADLLEMADRAMYAAKRLGRDRTISAADPVLNATWRRDPAAEASSGH